MAKSATSVNVYNSQSDFGHSEGAVEEKIIMYSATLYEYTREYVPTFSPPQLHGANAQSPESDANNPLRLWMQARKQAEREAASRTSPHKRAPSVAKPLAHQA